MTAAASQDQWRAPAAATWNRDGCWRDAAPRKEGRRWQ
jgi:hypothetical protein